MSEYIETVSTEDANAVIDSKLRKVFDGRIVRKDLRTCIHKRLSSVWK